MKICLVSQEYPPETGGGGIGTQTYLKAQGLTARGHEVHVVSATWEGPPRTYQDGRATIHRILMPQPTLPGGELSTVWLAYSSDVAAKVNALSQAIPFDIYQFPEYGGEGFIYQTDTFAVRSGRFVVQMHGPLGMFVEHMEWPERDSTFARIGCFMEQMVLHHADGLMASSRCSASFCAKAYGIDLAKVRVIHSAIDTTRFALRPQPQESRHPRILFVGLLAGNKGLGMLVKAVLNLRRSYPHIHLRTIGKGEPDYIASMEELIAQANGQAHVEIKGYVPYDELPSQYTWCDLFAGPSMYEPGPGNVYLEAMCSGRPVIACNSGGAPEVVLHNQTGLLIPANDQAALEEAIVTLAEDGALRQRLGKNGREWIESNFAFEKYIDKVESFYRELAS